MNYSHLLMILGLLLSGCTPTHWENDKYLIEVSFDGEGHCEFRIDNDIYGKEYGLSSSYSVPSLYEPVAKSYMELQTKCELARGSSTFEEHYPLPDVNVRTSFRNLKGQPVDIGALEGLAIPFVGQRVFYTDRVGVLNAVLNDAYEAMAVVDIIGADGVSSIFNIVYSFCGVGLEIYDGTVTYGPKALASGNHSLMVSGIARRKKNGC